MRKSHEAASPARNSSGCRRRGTHKLAGVHVAGQEGKFEIARHDADDDVGLAIEKDGGPEDVGPALVMALPQAVTEHDDRLLLLVFGLGKGAAEERRDLQRGKDLTAHANGMDCFGDACGGQIIACMPIAAEVGKAVGVAHVVADVRSAGSRPGAHIAWSPRGCLPG